MSNEIQLVYHLEQLSDDHCFLVWSWHGAVPQMESEHFRGFNAYADACRKVRQEHSEMLAEVARRGGGLTLRPSNT